MEWLRLDEERHYAGATEADVAAAFREALSEALAEGLRANRAPLIARTWRATIDGGP
jgi:urease accessory protein UreF